MRLMLLLVSLLGIFLPATKSEIIPLGLILDANSDEIHYVPFWLEAPGTVDMSDVTFITSIRPDLDDDFWLGRDDDSNNDGDDERGDDEGVGDDGWEVDEGTPAPSSSKATTSEPVATPAPQTAARATPAPTARATDEEDPSTTTDAPIPTPDEGGEEEPEDTDAPTTSSGAETPAPSPAVSTVVSQEETTSPTGAPLDRRILNQDEVPGGGGQKTQQAIDIVLFQVPDDCKRNKWGGCDWTLLGVGIRDEWMPGGVGYCCSAEAVSNGSCSSDDLGRLLVNHNMFQGVHKVVPVPSENNQEFTIDEPVFDIQKTGDYVMLFANCFDPGMDVFTMGTMSSESEKGYKLPGELYDLMFFYVGMTIAYFVIILWYWCGMRMFQESSIPIQRFILMTLILGLLEFFMRALDLGIWNLEGVRSAAVIWSAVVIGVLKRGIMRSLFVMVSMGWGVVRDSLGLALFKIIILGLLYCGLTMLRDFLAILAVEKVESWSSGAEEELLDLTFLATLGVVAINLIFFFWVISSLFATTEYLKNMNQTTKLRRHLRLRCIILTAFAIAMVWFIFSIVDGVMNILTTNQFWLLEGAMHLNNLFVIGSVAILWRPNANAKDYAMQLQLATGDDDTENELELSCVVPSAEDIDDGNDPDHANGIPVDDAVVA